MAALCSSPAKHLSASGNVSEGFTCRPVGKEGHRRAFSLSNSIACSSAAVSVQPATLQRTKGAVQSAGVLQCPAAAPLPKVFEGDWNSRMLFNRGLETVKDVDKDSLWTALQDAGDKPVVLDMYSKWCGPCRLIYPKLVKLSGKYDDVVFLKLDCSSDNKTVFSKLGIGILPTFKIFKNSSLVSEVKGAKYEELVTKIEKARLS